MARDYGRRGPVRRKSNAPRQLISILASFLCGYLTATVFDFTSLSHWVNQNVLATKQQAPSDPKPQPKEAALPKPKFEFYTLLSKDNSAPTTSSHRFAQAEKPKAVATPVASNPMPAPSSIQPLPQQVLQAPQKQQPKPVLANNTYNKPAPQGRRETYLVQLAAFNRRQDAEHLKASLTLKGFNVSISTIAHNGTNWFRVILGPYASRPDAEKAQMTVARSERIKGIIRKDSYSA